MSIDILEKISKNIKKFNSSKLFDSNIDFFKSLNYPMDTMQEESNYSLDEFLEITGAEKNSYLKNEEIEKIEILFNLSEDEMAKEIKNFYIGDKEIQAYLFLGIKLKDKYLWNIGSNFGTRLYLRNFVKKGFTIGDIRKIIFNGTENMISADIKSKNIIDIELTTQNDYASTLFDIENLLNCTLKQKKYKESASY